MQKARKVEKKCQQKNYLHPLKQPFIMDKKCIFITGAGRGIGRTTADYFANKNWFVGLLDINAADLEATARAIGLDNCSVHVADVRDVEQLEAALGDFSRRTHGQLNVLFNNAGFLRSGGFGKVPLETQKTIVDINFTGLMNVTHLALPLLKATPDSVIVNMCSASSVFGNPDLTAYAATKAAVKSLTEGWNMLFEKYNIHVTDLLPSYVDTRMVTDEQATMQLDPRHIKLNVGDIAPVVWRAVHSRRRVHHYVGTDAHLLRWFRWLLPYPVFRLLIKKGFYEKSIAKN